MFAKIETKGATHIVIHIPHEGSEKALPALARMLEQNAVFIKENYNSHELVTPETSILLGKRVEFERDGEHIVVSESSAVVDETFVNATPLVLASNAAAKEKARQENTRLQNEIRVLRDQIAAANETISQLTQDDEK